MDKRFDKKSQLFFEIFFFGLIAVFLFWRIRYGYYGSDENFLFGLAQRLYYGESLLVNEWNGCQHTGIFLYPFYWIYYKLFNSVEGMSLYFRIVYCILYLLVLLYVNKKLRHLAPYSYPAILCIALFTPLDHMTLSYTTLSFNFLLIICVKIYKDLLLDHGDEKINGLILGLLFTGITLCYPYYAIVFSLLYVVIASLFIYTKVSHVEKSFGEEVKYYFKISIWAAISIGFSLVLYCIYIFSNTDLQGIMENLPQIFNDPQGIERSFLFAIYDALYTSLMTGNESLLSGLLYYGSAAVLIIASMLSERIRKHRVLILFLMLPLWIYSEWNIFIDSLYKLNRQMKDIFMVGILAFVLLKNRPWKLFLTFYINSIIYLLITWFSSNTGLHVLSMGYAPGSICAVIMLALVAREISQEYKNTGMTGMRRAFALSGAVLLIAGQLALEFKVRCYGTYHDGIISQLSEKIEHGPSKGIYTSPGRYKEYYDEYNNFVGLSQYIERKEGSFLALNSSPLIYIMADMPCASYSTWMLGDDNTEERVRRYYDINNITAPEYIYDQNSSADISIITDEEYSLIEYGTARLYIKN